MVYVSAIMSVNHEHSNLNEANMILLIDCENIQTDEQW